VKTVKTLSVRNRSQWHSWLSEHHDTEKEVWLLYYRKHTGREGIAYEDSVEEAICFGWVDSLIRRIDGDRYARKFTPRRDGARWSELNRRRVEKLIGEGRMAEPGLSKAEFMRQAKGGEAQAVRMEELDPSFERVLRKERKAWENFRRLAPSYRRLYAKWIMSAKREETRRRRLEEAIGLLAQNRKLGLK
jgi:uncharacterized protein YdeI (YjbR/CyaY-like superfamily)